jgi:hypothetical protein
MKEQEIIHNTQREIILGYYNKIFLNKMSVEEILQTLEADIAFLGQQDATIQVNNLLGLSEESVSISDRDKFAIEFAKWMSIEGFTYSDSFGYCLSENPKYCDNDGFPIEHSLEQLLQLFHSQKQTQG